MKANAADGGGVVRRAWERVIATASAAEEKEKEKEKKEGEGDDDVTFLSVNIRTEEYAAVSCLELAPYVFPPQEYESESTSGVSDDDDDDDDDGGGGGGGGTAAAGEKLAEKWGFPVEVIHAYATHRLLSEDGFYFKSHTRGAFAPRRDTEMTALRREVKEQAEEDEAQYQMWSRLRDAISAAPGAKPRQNHFSDGSLLELRMESLEAYALGEGCYSSGQKAAAHDALKRVNMRCTERSAFDLLVAIGRWGGFENLALRRYDVPVSFGSRLEAQATALLASPPPDEDASTRKDLTRLTVYAIDSDDTVEIDDGVSAEFLENGRIRVWIHVADATRYVHLGTELDEEAKRRANSGKGSSFNSQTNSQHTFYF